MTPAISVIMSCYNESKDDLDRSISSILKQSYKNIEFIIVNDNPQNESIRLTLDGINDNRVTIINNDTNLGLVNSLNKALNICSGKYIARMDADDESAEDRLEKQLNYLLQNKLDIVGSYIHVVDETHKLIRDILFFKEPNEINKYIKYVPCIAHPTWLVKQEVYKKLGGYRDINYCEDYDFILRAIHSGYKIGNIPEFLLKYTIRENGISRKNLAEQKVRSKYLSGLESGILTKSEHVINYYFNTTNHHKAILKYLSYEKYKEKIRNGNYIYCLRILMNENFYDYLISRVISSRLLFDKHCKIV